MIKHNDFARMWIVVQAGLQEHLTNNKVLVCSHERVQFAMALSRNAAQAQAVRAGLEERRRPAYYLPVEDAVLDALAAGETIEVRVLDGSSEVVGAIRLSGGKATPLRTEHGPQAVKAVLLSELKTGDLFAISERHLISREWVVYRALNSGAEGQVEAQYTVKADRPTQTFTGEDQVVYLLLNTGSILDEISAREVAAS